MLFMNEWDIVEARAQFESHPVLSRATTFLEWLANETNEHSDGWAHWRKPCHAARKLQELIQEAQQQRRDLKPITATDAQYKATLTPIKRFFTTNGNKAGMVYKPWNGAGD